MIKKRRRYTGLTPVERAIVDSAIELEVRMRRQGALTWGDYLERMAA